MTFCASNASTSGSSSVRIFASSAASISSPFGIVVSEIPRPRFLTMTLRRRCRSAHSSSEGKRTRTVLVPSGPRSWIATGLVASKTGLLVCMMIDLGTTSPVCSCFYGVCFVVLDSAFGPDGRSLGFRLSEARSGVQWTSLGQSMSGDSGSGGRAFHCLDIAQWRNSLSSVDPALASPHTNVTKRPADSGTRKLAQSN